MEVLWQAAFKTPKHLICVGEKLQLSDVAHAKLDME